jgi:hypothetical protein
MAGQGSQCIFLGNQRISQKLQCPNEYRATGGKLKRLRFKPSIKEVGPMVGL